MSEPGNDRIFDSWQRRGLLLQPPAGNSLWVTHAQAPTVLKIHAELWRIYVTGRDQNNCGRIFAFDVAPHRNMEVLAVHPEPLLSLGAPGSFDEAGMGPSCALRIGDRFLLYYTGVSGRRDEPYPLAIGIAVSHNALDFERLSTEPVVDRSLHDPLFVSTPWVGLSNQGFEMLYMSGKAWTAHESGPSATYGLQRMHSQDGVTWLGIPEPILVPGNKAVQGLSRPWVTRHADGNRLWLCRRGADFRRPGPHAYRIEGIPLPDNGGNPCGKRIAVRYTNPPAPGDFDDWMQAYACVVRNGCEMVMFYNGNDFGRAGVGWATRPLGLHGIAEI